MPSIPASSPAVSWRNKVPAVTLAFWGIKIMSTTVGETVADTLAVDIGLGMLMTDLTMASLLALALWIQMRTRRCVPWIYWLTVVLVSVVGTQITDVLTDRLEISLCVSTAAFAGILAVVFALWYRQERTLSINAIDSLPREAWYWGAILCTFALGTAAGDLATEALGLGFQIGVLLFSGLIALIALAYRLGINAVFAFWAAYVLTRPLGAALGDLLSQDTTYGGLGFGALGTSGVFLTVIAVGVYRAQRQLSTASLTASMP